jgi:hypothetical protein
VQRYPQDYDGVLSGAPAINWTHFTPARLWSIAVANEIHAVAQCKFDAARRAAIAACDSDDGARDGLISDVGTCRFDAKALVGVKTDCGVIDDQDSEVIRRIWDGPRRRDGARLWFGVERAVLIHAPAPPTNNVVAFLDGKTPDASGLTTASFERLFDQFVERYGAVMDTASPALQAFAQRGGKTIIWHGVEDDLIPVAGSVEYVESIRRTVGQSKAESFLRFYLAPGVQHCQYGDGPHPVALLGTLMEWVEHGRAPASLRSEKRDQTGKVIRTRPLCPYPEHVRYQGQGSIEDAASFHCER